MNKNLRTAALLATLSLLIIPRYSLADTLPACEADTSVKTEIKRAIFTSGVANREPVDELTSVPQEIRELFLFTDVRKGKDTRISHVWYKGDTRIAFADLRIGSSRWRTWSRLAGSLLNGAAVHVDLIHNEQCLLLRKMLPAASEVATASDTAAAVTIAEPAVENTTEETPPAVENSEAGAPADSSRQKNKISAKNYAEQVKEAALHYRDAQHAKLAGDYDQAETHLQNALDAIPESSPSREVLRDELKLRIPLLRLDGYLLALDATAAQREYDSISSYIDNHPNKEKLSEQLREYKSKLDAMQ